MQVLDGHCYDPVEVAAAAKAASPSDREDSPAVGGVGDDDDEPDYEPEAEDASDDDDPVPGRAAARSAEVGTSFVAPPNTHAHTYKRHAGLGGNSCSSLS